MKWVAAFILTLTAVSTSALAAGKGPEVDLIDNKLSISADAISLSKLLQLVDMATGMKSKVPADLANRRISVRFSDLSVNDAVRKIFQGQPFDYVMVPGQGVIVTAASQSTPGTDSPQPYTPQQNAVFEQPFTQDFPPPTGAQLPPIQQGQPQPPMLQTPFGPMANPRALPPQQTAPVIGAQPQNSLFPQNGQPITGEPNQNQQGFPLIQPVPANQFGAPSTFGTVSPTPANPANSLFGNPPVFNSPANQQR